MKTIDEFYKQFIAEINDLWPDEVKAALNEKVTAETILKYLHRDKVRLTKIVNCIGKIGKNKKVLDIGCAYGFYDIILKENFNCDVTGIEMEESTDAYCRLLKKYNIPVIHSTLSKNKCPIEDESFDIVIFSEILEHLRLSPLRALCEVTRMLKPGGTMLLTTPNIGYLRNVIHLLTGKNILQPFPENDENLDNITDSLTHTRIYVMSELIDLTKKSGFEIIEANYLSGEKLNLALRLNLIPHIIYMLLITTIPSFRDSLIITAKKV